MFAREKHENCYLSSRYRVLEENSRPTVISAENTVSANIFFSHIFPFLFANC